VTQHKLELRANEQSLALADTLKHPHSLGHALQNATITRQLAGDHEAVDRIAQRAIEFTEKYNFRPQRAHALILSGWARAIGRDSDAGLELMEPNSPEHLLLDPTSGIMLCF
jgi:hypothetical protein